VECARFWWLGGSHGEIAGVAERKLGDHPSTRPRSTLRVSESLRLEEAHRFTKWSWLNRRRRGMRSLLVIWTSREIGIRIEGLSNRDLRRRVARHLRDGRHPSSRRPTDPTPVATASAPRHEIFWKIFTHVPFDEGEVPPNSDDGNRFASRRRVESAGAKVSGRSMELVDVFGCAPARLCGRGGMRHWNRSVSRRAVDSTHALLTTRAWSGVSAGRRAPEVLPSVHMRVARLSACVAPNGSMPRRETERFQWRMPPLPPRRASAHQETVTSLTSLDSTVGQVGSTRRRETKRFPSSELGGTQCPSNGTHVKIFQKNVFPAGRRDAEVEVESGRRRTTSATKMSRDAMPKVSTRQALRSGSRFRASPESPKVNAFHGASD
jgi:hypothetical protein